MADITSEYMTRKEAAAYITRKGIRITLSTLNKYARIGSGPEFFRPGQTRYGPVFYSCEAIEGWLDRVDPRRGARGAR